jgi:hypothetical protein
MDARKVLSVMSKTEEEEKPLDDLLSLRGKPFADWKEERKYLRDKWGMQGRDITNENMEPGVENTPPKNQKDVQS